MLRKLAAPLALLLAAGAACTTSGGPATASAVGAVIAHQPPQTSRTARSAAGAGFGERRRTFPLPVTVSRTT